MERKPLYEIALISVIIRELRRQGLPELYQRQLDTITDAVDTIAVEMSEPYRPAVANMGIYAWCECDDTSEASLYMAGVLTNQGRGPLAWPVDAVDFGECLGLLNAAPELRARLGLMSETCPEWRAIVVNWNELEALWIAGYDTLTDRIFDIVRGPK